MLACSDKSIAQGAGLVKGQQLQEVVNNTEQNQQCSCSHTSPGQNNSPGITHVRCYLDVLLMMETPQVMLWLLCQPATGATKPLIGGYTVSAQCKPTELTNVNDIGSLSDGYASSAAVTANAITLKPCG